MKNIYYFKSLFRTSLVALCLMTVGVGNAWGGNRRIYFDYSAVTMWPDASAEMKVHCWGGNEGDADYTMSAVAGESNLIYCDIDDGWTNLCFYRKDPNSSSWWTKTFDYNNIGSNNRFKIKNETVKDGIDKYKWADSGAAIRWNPCVCVDGLVDVHNPHNQAFSFSGNDGTYAVTLSAHSTYQFCIRDGSTRYTLDNNVWTSNISNYTLNTSGYDIRLTTAGAGTYTFTYNKSTHVISVAYPTVSHPNIDYCYMYGYTDWDHKYLHVWNSSSSIAGTTWPGTEMFNYITISSNKYYYYAPGDYAKSMPNNNNDGQKTSELTNSQGYGKYMKHNGSAWVWNTFTVRIQLENNGANVGEKGTEYVDVAFNSDALGDDIEVPVKDGYTFGGYYTEDGGSGTQLISATGEWTTSAVDDYLDESHHWIHAGMSTTLYAKWTEDKHTVTVEIGSAGGGVFSYGGSSSLTTKEISGIGISTATGDIVVDSLNPAWRFKKWEYDGAKITITTGGYTSKTIRVNATADATITAVFEPRFGLIGSLNEDGDPAGGMPNKDGKTWGNVRSEDYEADFEVISFTAVGTGEGTGVDLRCTRTLESNKQYKFQIVDRATVGRDRFCLAAGGSTLLEANESITLNYKEQSNANVLINTIGYGEYTFRITNIAATTYNPTVTVDRPTDSKQLTLKCGYSIDAASSVTLSNDGGTAMGHTDEGGDGFDISDGGFFKSGSHITFTATPATGYVFEGWYTDNTYGTRFATANPMTMTEGTNANVTVYARFIEKTNTFTDGASTGMWNNTSNWSLGSLPTINERVVITKPVTVDIAHALAKRIILDQSSSNTGKLTVQADKGLEVAGTIQVYNGSSYGPTTEADLILESSSSAGNASLIFNNSNSCAATVQMYSKASISGSTWNWQYVGTPFTGSIPLYNYYGSWMYKWNNGWDVVHGGDELTPFVGYCLTQQSATTHVMGGTLVSTTDDVEVTMAASTDMVLANSWTAPIYIGGFTSSTFTSTPATIYLFNTGMATKESGGASAGTEAGTYETVPVNAALYFGTEFIPSMQGFFVTTQPKGGSGKAGKITLKYDELVRPDGYRTSITTGQMYAPRRAKAADAKPEVMKIRANGAQYSDHLFILAREDFSEGFDNGWDGEKLSFGTEAPSVYVINQQGGYDAVSAIPSFEGTLVGFRAGANNSCTLNFEYDGYETLYLNDLQEQQSTLIDAGHTYTFTTSAYDSEARFIISASPIRKITTGNENVGAEAAKVRKLIINDKVYIIRAGRLFSVDGQMVK